MFDRSCATTGTTVALDQLATTTTVGRVEQLGVTDARIERGALVVRGTRTVAVVLVPGNAVADDGTAEEHGLRCADTARLNDTRDARAALDDFVLDKRPCDGDCRPGARSAWRGLRAPTRTGAHPARVPL